MLILMKVLSNLDRTKTCDIELIQLENKSGQFISRFGEQIMGFIDGADFGS